MTFIQQWQTGGGGGGGRAQHLDTTYDPIALYKLDGNVSDSSDSGFNDLTVIGNERYADVGLGLRGFFFDGSSSLELASSEAILQITGDLTIECIVTINMNTAAGQLLVYHAATGETEATNVLYQITALQTTNQMDYFAEYGVGSNINYSAGACFTAGEAMLLGVVRSSNNVTFYVNGLQIGDASSGLVAPTGGGDGTLKIGSAYIEGGAICSVKILNTALTADQMKAEFNRSLGPVLGELP